MSPNQRLPHFPPLRIEHPFKPRNALLFSLVTGVILTGIIHIDDLRFSQYAPFSTSHTLFTFVHMLLLCCMLFLYNFHLFHNLSAAPADRQNPNRTFLWSIIGTLAIAALFSILSSWVGACVTPALGIDIRIDIGMIKDGFVALTAILITILLYNLTRHQRMLLEEERTQTENIQNRYDALEKQIDPHFLFNSLNTLDGLIGYDDNRAHHYLQQLALSYRYIMQQQRLVPLADEMRFTDNFIAMMRIRYGDSFQVETRINPACFSTQIVPISIQLLVENALQHNIVSKNHPLTVTIASAMADEKNLCLVVSNPLQPKNDSHTDPHGSIGLRNLSQRCQLTLHRDIVIRQTHDTFTVQIPLLNV